MELSNTKEISLIDKKFGQFFKNFATGRTKDPSLADDLVQEAYCNYLKATQKGGGPKPGKERPYILNTIRNIFVDQLKKTSRERSLGDNISTGGTSPEDEVTKREFTCELNNIINTMTPNQQKVVRAHYLDGMSIKETSRKLGLTEANVKVIAHRSIKELKEKLKGKILD